MHSRSRIVSNDCLPAIDVVSEEEVIGRRREATHLEQAQQVVVLAMRVTDDLDGRAELDERRLREEDLARSLADGGDLGVFERRLGILPE